MNLYTLDFETDPFLFGRPPEPFAGCLFGADGSTVLEWGDDCAENIAESISELPDDAIIYAHNGGKFDFHFLLPWLDEKIKLINGRIAECSIQGRKLRDSYLMLPIPLSAHKKDEIEYSKFERDVRELYRAEITTYLINDCKYLLEWVQKFIDRFGNKSTLASTAFKVLKDMGYDIERTPESYDSVFRQFYFGGRVQCFERGIITDPLEYFDINSAYPYAMLDKHPQGDKYMQVMKMPESSGGWFADIEAVSFGALPVRDKEGKLQFPNDGIARRYCVTGWEVIAGLETGTLKIKKVRSIYKHSQYRSFSDYILRFHKEKTEAEKNGDTDSRTFAKLLMNSAYGKFAQNPRDFKDWLLVEKGELPDGWSFHSDIMDKSFLNKPTYEPGGKPLLFYNVATGASITGFVRAYLWRAICASVRPVYCDTDSLMCGKFGGRQGENLGEWKKEGDIQRAAIGGRKFYAVEGIFDKGQTTKSATKGFRADVPEIFRAVENNSIILWKKDAPSYSVKYGARFVEREIRPEYLTDKR